MSHTRIFNATVAGALLATAVVTGGAVNAGGAERASAVIIDVDGTEIGTAKFVEDADGTVHVNVKVASLPAGKHGVHLHENASCVPSPGPFSGAGGHYNPGSTSHADHAGDLPNLIVNAAGRGHLNATTTRVTLSAGPTTLFDTTGSAIIIHANEDDFGSVANGNSGGRVACGAIISG